MKIRVFAILLLSAALFAQETEPAIRLDRYTPQDLARIKEAREASNAAYEAYKDTKKQIYREHGIVEETPNCTPYDHAEERGNTLVITHITPQPDKKGNCYSDSGGEGYRYLMQ